jgi:hypothetical protein
MDHCYRMVNITAAATIITVGLGFGMGQAAAQTTCLAYQEGTVGCPVYGAPAATAVPGPSMDGGVTVTSAGGSTLFGGKVPPNGFMVRVFAGDALINLQNPPFCYVNDGGSGAGLPLVPDAVITIGSQAFSTSLSFASPYGYKPMGPVSIFCDNGTPLLVARGW